MIRKLECNARLQGIDMHFSRRFDDSVDQNLDDVVFLLFGNLLNFNQFTLHTLFGVLFQFADTTSVLLIELLQLLILLNLV